MRKIQRINERKSWFFENIDKIDNFLAKQTKRKRKKTQTNKIRAAKADSETDRLENQRT